MTKPAEWEFYLIILLSQPRYRLDRWVFSIHVMKLTWNSPRIAMDFAENWLLMALLTPTVWAMACLLDSFLVGNKIYRHPSDGMVVTCLFCVLPVLFVLSWDYTTSTDHQQPFPLSWSAIGAGLSFATHVLFYFRILFKINDVSGAETFVALSILLVPYFSWLILDEVLPARYYIAFFLASGGVALQCWPVLRRLGWPTLLDMLICLTAISLAMVLQAKALMQTGFVASTIVFNLTCIGVALTLALSNRRLRERIINVFRRFTPLLVLSESLGVLALVFSHRATQIGPSVSLVALIECLLPLIIILISFLLITLNRFLPLFSGEHQKILIVQISGVPSKTLAAALLFVSFSSLSF